MRFSTAESAIEWIHGVRWKGEKSGLRNERALLALLGDPQRDMKLIHVAGTNGKGSVCAMIAKGLEKAGYRTGLYTSPYIVKFNERIRLNGMPIPDGALIECASAVSDAAEKLTESGIFCTTFELITAAAFVYYRMAGAEWAVIEVGLGGTYDSTNVIEPELSVITRIGMDHMHILGDTITEIAGEKAGIIKPGVPVVTMDQLAEVNEVFASRAGETGSKHIIAVTEGASFDKNGAFLTFRGKTVRVNLPGFHQAENAYTALTALEAVGVGEEAAAAGVGSAVWPVRLEWIGNVLIDGAHNPQGAEALARYVREFLEPEKIVLLTGMMRDKQLEGTLSILRKCCGKAVLTRVDWPRAAEPEEMLPYLPGAECERDTVRAFERAKALAGADGIVLTAGSLYLAGAVRGYLLPDDPGKV